MKIQLPTILSGRRHSDEPKSDNRVTDRKGEQKVSFEQPNVTALMEKLQNSNSETTADCGRSTSQSDSSGSSQPSPVRISLLPDSPVPKKRSLFRKESRKNARATSGPNDQSETSPHIMKRTLESPRNLSVSQKDGQDEFSGSSQSSNLSNFPSNEDLSGNSQSISPDVQQRQGSLAQSSISETSPANKRRLYRAGRKGSASTSSIKKIEPIRVQRVGSTSSSPRDVKPGLNKADSSKNPQEDLASKSSEDVSNQVQRRNTERNKEKKYHENLEELGADVNLQMLIEQLVTTTAAEDRSRIKRKNPTRQSMKRRSLSLDSVSTRPPVVKISSAPEAEEALEDSIGKLIQQLNQSDPSLNRKSTQRRRQRETLDSTARLGPSRGRSAESPPRKGSPRSPSKSKQASRSKSRDPDFSLMIESLKNPSDDSVAVIAIDDELLELPLEEVPESREIRRLIRSLKASKDNEEQAAIQDCLNKLMDFQTK